METNSRHRISKTVYTEISVRGLTCAGESATLERSLETLAGIERAIVNPITEKAYVWYDPDRCTTQAMRALIERSGYRPL